MSILDITDPSLKLPEVLILDASILLETLPSSPRHPVITSFLSRIRSAAMKGELLCLVASITFQECYHKLIQRSYEKDLPAHIPRLKTKVKSPGWQDLYKDSPQLIQGYIPALQSFRASILAIPVAPIEPSDLGASPQALDARLLYYVEQVPILPADAYLLAIAERLNAPHIATLDKDFLAAARLSFHIYTII